MSNSSPTSEQGHANHGPTGDSAEPSRNHRETLYPLNDVSLLVKTYSHDLRNTLNGMDLDLTLLGEASDDPQILETTKRLQATAAEIGRQVQGLIAKFGIESPFEIPVIQIAERWKVDMEQLEASPTVEWNIESTDELVYTEAGLVRNLLWEMILVSQRICPKQPLQLSCFCNEGHAVFRVAVAGCPMEPRRLQLQSPFWLALCRLAERCHGSLVPAVLEEQSTLDLRLLLPLMPTEGSGS